VDHRKENGRSAINSKTRTGFQLLKTKKMYAPTARAARSAATATITYNGGANDQQR
jgi:hypothetical protein